MQGHRRLVEAIADRAYSLAAEGKQSESDELLNLARDLSLRMSAEAETLLEFLAGEAGVSYTNATDLAIAALLGQPAREAAARERLTADRRAWVGGREEGMRVKRPEDLDGAGLLWSTVTPCGLREGQMDFEPTRNAEKAVLAQMALLVLLAVLLLITAVQGAGVLVSLRRRRGEQRALLLWIGWRRIGWICLWSIVVPLVVYLLYARVLTGCRSRYGLNVIGVAVGVEYFLLGTVMIALLLIQIRRAVRSRALELGLAVPPPARPGQSGHASCACGVGCPVCVRRVGVVLDRRAVSPWRGQGGLRRRTTEDTRGISGSKR